jgi:hypothetical protein
MHDTAPEYLDDTCELQKSLIPVRGKATQKLTLHDFIRLQLGLRDLGLQGLDAHPYRCLNALKLNYPITRRKSLE